jgi:hypothetical protein
LLSLHLLSLSFQAAEHIVADLEEQLAAKQVVEMDLRELLAAAEAELAAGGGGGASSSLEGTMEGKLVRSNPIYCFPSVRS